MIRSRWTFYCLAILAVSTLPGCGGDGKPPRYPVTGTVTFDGKPVTEGGSVNFYRKETGPVATPIGAEGKFDFKDSKGVEAGEYQVFISAPPSVTGPPSPAANMEIKVFPDYPQKYSQALTSGLTATVEAKEEGNTYSFEMVP